MNEAEEVNKDFGWSADHIHLQRYIRGSNHSLHQMGLVARGGQWRDGHPSLLGFRFFLTAGTPYRFLAAICVLTMGDNSHERPRGRDSSLSPFSMAINGLNLTKEFSSITPAQAVFGSVSVLLTMIRVCFLLFCDERFQVCTWPGYSDQ